MNHFTTSTQLQTTPVYTSNFDNCTSTIDRSHHHINQTAKRTSTRGSKNIDVPCSSFSNDSNLFFSTSNIFTPVYTSLYSTKSTTHLKTSFNNTDEIDWSTSTSPKIQQLSIEFSPSESSSNSISSPQSKLFKSTTSNDLITSANYPSTNFSQLPFELSKCDNSETVLNGLWLPYEEQISQLNFCPNQSKFENFTDSLEDSYSYNSIGEPKRRMQANARERDRTFSVNSAFKCLRSLIPTDPPSRKLSKIETLRLATSYITHLQNVKQARLNGDFNEYPCHRIDQYNYSTWESYSDHNENKNPSVSTIKVNPVDQISSSSDFNQSRTSYKRKSSSVCTFCITNNKKVKDN